VQLVSILKPDGMLVIVVPYKVAATLTFDIADSCNPFSTPVSIACAITRPSRTSYIIISKMTSSLLSSLSERLLLLLTLRRESENLDHMEEWLQLIDMNALDGDRLFVGTLAQLRSRTVQNDAV
jgi:hypothetical protein